MTMTIKELADELEVSKDKVKYQVRKLPSKLTSKKDGVVRLSDEAVSRVRLELLGKVTQVSPGEITHQLPTIFLETELDKKDNEIKEKNKQIDELHGLLKQQQKLLDQQQVLTLQANKKIAELETTLTQTEEEPKENEQIKTEKKNFWQRLFN